MEDSLIQSDGKKIIRTRFRSKEVHHQPMSQQRDHKLQVVAIIMLALLILIQTLIIILLIKMMGSLDHKLDQMEQRYLKMEL